MILSPFVTGNKLWLLSPLWILAGISSTSRNRSLLLVEGRVICGGGGDGEGSEPCGTKRAERIDEFQTCKREFNNSQAFKDVGGCWACPAHFKRTIAYSVDSEKACFRADADFVTDEFATGIYVQDKRTSCPSGQFKDLRNGGECWSCPKDYVRTAEPVDGPRACIKGSVLLVNNPKAAANFESPLSCPTPSFLDVGTQKCYKCPAGYYRASSVYPIWNDRGCVATGGEHQPALSLGDFGCDKANGEFYDVFTDACWKCPDYYTRSFVTVGVQHEQACRSIGFEWEDEPYPGKKYDTVASCVIQLRCRLSFMGHPPLTKQNSSPEPGIFEVYPEKYPLERNGGETIVHGFIHIVPRDQDHLYPFVAALMELFETDEGIIRLNTFFDVFATKSEVGAREFIATVWQEISETPRESEFLKVYLWQLLLRISASKNEGEELAENQVRMVSAFERYVADRRLQAAYNLKMAVDAWFESPAAKISVGLGNVEEMNTIMMKPPDFVEIAAKSLRLKVAASSTIALTTLWSGLYYTFSNNFHIMWQVHGFSKAVWANKIFFNHGKEFLQNLPRVFTQSSAYGNYLTSSSALRYGSIWSDLPYNGPRDLLTAFRYRNFLATQLGPAVAVTVMIIIAQWGIETAMEIADVQQEAINAVAKAKADINVLEAASYEPGSLLAQWLVSDGEEAMLLYFSLMSVQDPFVYAYHPSFDAACKEAAIRADELDYTSELETLVGKESFVCATAELCAIEAMAQGLQIGGAGFAFSSSSYPTKGCYFYPSTHSQYANMAFFGKGGTAAQMEDDLSSSSVDRLTCGLTNEVAFCHDEKSCFATALDRGYTPGYPFSGDFQTKGCYYYPFDHSLYPGMVFFGQGGSTEQMDVSPLEPKHRVLCSDDDAVLCHDSNTCEKAAKALGLQLGGGGYAFAGPYSSKGCYFYPSGAYMNMAFFGTGGNSTLMSAAPGSGKRRLSLCEEG